MDRSDLVLSRSYSSVQAARCCRRSAAVCAPDFAAVRGPDSAVAVPGQVSSSGGHPFRFVSVHRQLAGQNS